jgi:hypothetical protein
MDVRIGTVTSVTLQALRVGDHVLLPVAKVQELAGLHSTRDTSSYLPTDSLSLMLHASIMVDWDDLAVTITDDGTLPVSLRAARAERRAQFNMEKARVPPHAEVTHGMSALPHDLVIDYDLVGATASGRTQPSVRLGLGSNILGGGIDIDWTRVGRYSAPPTISWKRSWPELPLLRDVRVGSVPLAHGAPGTGLFMSSMPPAGDYRMEPLTYSGMLQPGWDIEAYHDGILMYAGLTDSVGNYTVNIPASRGINRITLAAHGPHNELRVINRYVSIGSDMLRAGTGAYNMSLGHCAAPHCDYSGDFSARYAPLSYLTIGAGVSDILNAGVHTVRPSALFATRVGDDINAAASLEPGDTGGNLRYAPSEKFEAAVAYRTMTYTVGENVPLIHQSSAVFSAIWRRHGSQALTARADLSGRNVTDDQRLLIGSSLSVGAVYIHPFVSVTRRLDTEFTVLDYGGYAESSIPFLLPRGSRIRGGFGDALLGDTFLTVAIPFARVGRIEMGGEWPGGMHAPQLTMSLSLISRAVRYDARSSAPGSKLAATTHTLSGSIVLADHPSSDSRHATFAASQSRGRSAIAGTVFLDDNHNGNFDSSELPIPAVSIMAGSINIEAGQAGDYHLHDVIAFVPVVLSVDSLTLPFPDMEVRPVRVIPLPNGTTHVDLPVYRRVSDLAAGDIDNFDRLAQDAEGRYSSSVHSYDFESGARNPDPVTDAWQSAQPRENVPSKR